MTASATTKPTQSSIPASLTVDELTLLLESVAHEAEWCREEAYNNDPEWTQKAEALDALHSKLERWHSEVILAASA